MKHPCRITHNIRWFALCIVFSATLHAQSDSLVTIPFSQVRGIEFSVGPMLTLRPFLGGTISTARYMENGKKVRLGISLNAQTSDGQSKGVEHRADTLYSNSSNEGESSTIQIGFSAQYIRYASTRLGLSPFVGVGPVVRRTWSKSNSDMLAHPAYSFTETHKSEHSTSEWGVGLAGLIGVEWFFAENMSLHAEYGLEAMYLSGSSIEDSKSDGVYYYYPPKSSSHSESSYSMWQIRSPGILFGVTFVY